MLKYHDIEQNTEIWQGMRAAKLTSSKLACIMANYGKAFGEPAKKYAKRLAIEKITGKPSENGYSNGHMDRGHEEEPIARALYEQEMFVDVLNGGFFCNDKIGCSPDGLVGDDGLIEIKSAIGEVHLTRVESKKHDSAYTWQLLGNMLYTSREWIDFISYCSEFPAGKRLYVKRLFAKDYQKEFRQIKERSDQFLELVAQKVDIIQDSRYINL